MNEGVLFLSKTIKKYNRSPLNWVGNKFKYLEEINKLVGGGKYTNIFDVFMGSGNILLNLDCEAINFVGNDNIPLTSKLYEAISMVSDDFTLEELEDIIGNWDNFSDKKNYYDFRDYWNGKYLNNVYNRSFILETIALLKMCSNSMVRFNPSKGYFNQGFRGLAKGKKEFFSEVMKSNIIKQLNILRNTLTSKSFHFTVGDFKDTLLKTTENDLIILDPPYILRADMYDTNFSKDDDSFLLEFIDANKCSYVYFNYLESGGLVNETLSEFITLSNPPTIVELNSKTLAGQGRVGTKAIKEVMISNII